MFTRFFIDRPIFASVLSIILLLAGFVAVRSLPIAQYPEITPPTVEVSAVYPGANARTVADTVAQPIEQWVNGVEDMLYMSSQSTNDGTYTLTVTFKPGIDLNIAQVLVQNRVNLAQPVLPELVKRRGVTVKKKSPSQLMIVNLYSPEPATAADAANKRDNLYLSNYATIQLRDALARLPGVGDITYLGQRDYSMRLWLDPEKMTAKNLSASDVVHAIEQQNAQVAAGQVGQPPAPTGQAFQYTINTLGRLVDEEQFREMILKTDDAGRVVRMRDVARVELGALGYDQTCTLDGRPSVALSVYQLPGTNAIDTAKQVKDKLLSLRRDANWPAGVEYAVVYDTTPFINASIDEVYTTLLEAVALVALVMLVFLQSWRAAVIPLAAVPVAIVGTFAAMALLGYSVNNLTLFGLVLAVGIVVDDAIVVVEAVQHHIERGVPPRDATARAMDDVAGPVVAVGLVLTAVFVPCVFISGIVGQFFKQFAVTIAVSTLISAFNSLTLSPALCALLLKSNTTAERREPLPRLFFLFVGGGLAAYFLAPFLADSLARTGGGDFVNKYGREIAWAVAFVAGAAVGYVVGRLISRVLGLGFGLFNRAFDAVTGGYLKVVGVALRVSLLVLGVYGGLLYLTVFTLDAAPTGFIPQQDKGYLLINVQLPDAASLGRTEAAVRRLEETVRKMPGVAHTVGVAGQSVLLGANAPNFATLYVLLDDFPQRLAPDLRADALTAKLQRDLSDGEPGAVVNVFGAPPVDGLGTAGGFKLVIEDTSGVGSQTLEETGRSVAAAGKESPAFADAFTGYRADTPWLFLDIDRVAAKTRGVSMAEAVEALQVFYGSLYVNDFNKFSRTWQVNVQAEANFRRKAEDLKRVQVRNEAGKMVPAGSFIGVRREVGPVMVQRYNLYPAAAVNATPGAGVSSGEAIGSLEGIARDKLPPGMRYDWTELAFLQLQTKDTAARAFVLSVVLVFLVLAAQYESWTLPLAVILVVPMCLLSAAVGVLVAGQDVNIFTQIGFVVLVGLACKNAILIVEFAKQRREGGADRATAALEACALRLRPIVMTSVAFIIGVVPLVLAKGAGGEMRRALGTAVFAGMIGVTAFGLFLTPVFFVVVQRVEDAWKRWRRRDDEDVGPVSVPDA